MLSGASDIYKDLINSDKNLSNKEELGKDIRIKLRAYYNRYAAKESSEVNLDLINSYFLSMLEKDENIVIADIFLTPLDQFGKNILK